ncbi:MAG: IS21-like element helper ATPase IstB [Bacteroidia bacterium]|nr:IS21-like element helper ATPase IstB [Bacteroidia bacterium]
MNTDTLEKMRKMKFYGMARAFKMSLEAGKAEQFTADQMVSLLIESEWDDRHNRSIERHISNARFRYKAAIEQIIYDQDRSVDRNQILRLAECDFISRNENILITGSTGIGKSFIASAIGHQACLLGYKTMYFNASKLFSQLKMAKGDGTYAKEISRIEKQHLIIIDDFGIQPLDGHNRSALMEIIEDRHAKASLIITAQVPVNMWHEVIGETTIVDAVLDRIVHGAHRIELFGESMRKKKPMVN